MINELSFSLSFLDLSLPSAAALFNSKSDILLFIAVISLIVDNLVLNNEFTVAVCVAIAVGDAFILPFNILSSYSLASIDVLFISFIKLVNKINEPLNLSS